MRGRGAGVLLIVALGARVGVGQEPIPLPVPAGPTLDVIQAGATLPIIKPNIPALPPTPDSGVPGPRALPKMPTDLPPAGAVKEGDGPAAGSLTEGHPIFVTPYHPEPPPATYATSGCNFNVWCGDDFFSPDFSTVQILVGRYSATKMGATSTARFEYVPVSLRTGMMLYSPPDTQAPWRGNLESICDLTAGYVTGGAGSYLFSPAGGLRYNFVQPNAWLVPYMQAGAGFTYAGGMTKKKKDPMNLVPDPPPEDGLTRRLGTRLFAGVGVHCFLRDNLFLDIETGVNHFGGSKAASDTAGVQIGLTYFLRSGGR